jgi:hypothetical protein
VGRRDRDVHHAAAHDGGSDGAGGDCVHESRDGQVGGRGRPLALGAQRSRQRHAERGRERYTSKYEVHESHLVGGA